MRLKSSNNNVGEIIILCFVVMQGINPIIAKKMIEERSKDYSNAKRVAREFDVQNKGIIRSIPSVPPQNTAEELKQVRDLPKYGCFVSVSANIA